MATQPGPALLYHFLRIGVSVFAAIFIVLRLAGLPPLLHADSTSDFVAYVAYVLTGIAVVLLLIGLFVLRPAVPARRAGQTTAEYWATPKAVQKAMSVWFIIEGAATLSSVAFLLTGHVVAAAAMVVSIVVFWMVTPEAFERPA
jgi:uncharacterized membrane protein